MPKNILQDIVKIKKAKKPEMNQGETPFSDLSEISYSDHLNTEEKRNTSYNMLWFVAFISILFLFFAVSFLFFNAKVTIDPRTKDFVLNETLTATKNTNADSLTYDSVILSDEESKEVKGGEEKDYFESASGTVLIYNTFSSSPQPLSIDTRLEGSNGKIYKTKTKIIVPGIVKNNVPGKVEVEIYGAEAGEEYNSAPIDFKILGFKGTSKYSKFYGRSVGEIKGGLKGRSSQLSESAKENAIKEIKEILFSRLLENVKNQIPKEFVLLKEATFFDTNEINITPTETGGNFLIKIKGTLNGILFNKEKLTKKIITTVLAEEKDTEVYISNIEELEFSQTQKSLFVLDEMKDITFNLSGTARIVWKIDSENLALDLLGKRKKDFSQILLKYPNIKSAEIKIKPVWKNSFPNKSEDIKIIINYPK